MKLAKFLGRQYMLEFLAGNAQPRVLAGGRGRELDIKV